MIVVTSIFVTETREERSLTLAHLDEARENEHEEESRELIGLYKGRNRVLPIE